MDEGLFGRMFRGQCNPQTQSAKATLGRCSRINNSNVISMDMDGRKIDVVIVDAPECSNQRSGHSTASLKPNKKCFPSRVVIIDEENGNYFGFRDADQSTMPSKTCHFSSGSHFPEESDSDECQVLKGKVRVDSPRWMFNASVADSDSDSDSDCEIMDDLSGNIRKEWEKAYLMKKRVMNNARSKKGSGVFESHNEHGVHSETSREKVNSVNTSGDTCLSPRKEETSETPANGEADLQVPCAADDFTGQTSLDSTRMHNDGIVDHSVGEASNLASGSQNKSEPFSKSMCGTKARPMRSFGHKVTSNSCGHDSPVRKCFPCNTTTEHGLNGHSNVDSMADGGNASMSMSDVQDKHQDGDVLGCRNSSPCDNDHLSSSEPRSRKVTRTAASLEPNSNLGEPLTDARSACSFKGKDSSQGTLQSIIKGMNPGVVEQSSLGMMDGMSDFQSDIIGERDKHKQSEGYRLAEEEEWASRREQIKIQVSVLIMHEYMAEYHCA